MGQIHLLKNFKATNLVQKKAFLLNKINKSLPAVGLDCIILALLKIMAILSIPMSKIKKQKKNRWALLHQYYKRTGFYNYLLTNLKKAGLPIILFVAALFLVNEYVININDLIKILTEKYSDFTIFSVFFMSESILGLVPPDIFIAWTHNTESPILYLSILAVLSFLGGIVSYLYGRAFLNMPKIKEYMENKAGDHIGMMRKWGGFLIAVGALLPLPFALACFAAGMIRYRFPSFLLFATLRFFRFIIYGYAIFSIM